MIHRPYTFPPTTGLFLPRRVLYRSQTIIRTLTPSRRLETGRWWDETTLESTGECTNVHGGVMHLELDHHPTLRER